MSKKKGLFSWFSKKPAKKTEQEIQSEVLAQQKAAEADQQAELAEQERVAADAEQQAKLAAEAAERETIQAEAEHQAKLAAEKAEQERLAAEAESQAKLAAEKAEQERLAAEAELQAKLAAEKAEQERLAAEAELQAKLAAEKAEQERLAAEAELQAKLAAEKAEQERFAAEAELQAKLAAEKAEQERLATEARLAAEQAQKEQAEKARQAYQEAQRNAELARQQVEQDVAEEAQESQEVETVTEIVEVEEDKKLGFFARFAQGLKKTRLSIGSGLLSLFKGKKIDDDLFEELEEQLIVADIGVETTLRIINNLTEHANRKQLKDAEVLYDLLKKDLSDILNEVEQPLVIDATKKPYVILMVGVNGVGKTTTIGKLAKKYQSEGKSVMLAAGDTFRAAAVEQLQVWGERNDIPVIAQQTGADSASVLFDAMDAAQARGVDVLIADTAGRLQNKDHLMTELAKVVRIMRKKDETAPHEIMLTIDAGTGQNAISQVKLFNEAVGLTGVTFTKLDGTAKGGIIFSIADQFKLPIRYIGVGEGIDDLREFNAKEFIDALFSKEEES
ncbi:signal recognition particle-docking protein FtsY [Psychromonas sp. 14N.309.X.WAT.B.A12]|uniref:signal recognition particle-docking protein FtsY n=1 Tax=Psychromonas sp. 14N.309.X.WAT.B.A12 TaxID=2998322 RepID=UPI0025AF96D5|nr:signal recognition particle-docking protein FtsY [Psychromonas sp. 14N.309.X.WAT.B.A12]MDN2662656.1 signal recognition particle-docking protein FtsY [Psychromonas sp. 14N.309.X.WAT.B.A12]